MRAKYRNMIKTPNGRVSFAEENLGSSPSFWAKQAKFSAKDHVKVSFATRTIKGKPTVVSVRSEFKDGTVMTSSLMPKSKLNKSNKSETKSAHKASGRLARK